MQTFAYEKGVDPSTSDISDVLSINHYHAADTNVTFSYRLSFLLLSYHANDTGRSSSEIYLSQHNECQKCPGNHPAQMWRLP